MAQRKQKSEIVRKGKTYLSKAEFARHFGVTRKTIYYHIKQKNIEISIIDGGEYIDLEKYENWFNKQLEESRRLGRRRTQKEEENKGYQYLPQSISKTNKQAKVAAPKKDIKVKKEEVSKEKVESVSDEMKTIIRSGDFSFDPDDPLFSDCWVFDSDGEPIINKITGSHLLDNKAADDKVKMMIHYQQLMKEAGKLIPREDVDYSLRAIASPIVNQIQGVPQKFLARFISYITRLTGKELKINEIETLKAELNDEAIGILQNFQKTIEDLTNG